MREGRGRLVLQGPGDPTGRGLGFSYLRDERRVRQRSAKNLITFALLSWCFGTAAGALTQLQAQYAPYLEAWGGRALHRRRDAGLEAQC